MLSHMIVARSAMRIQKVDIAVVAEKRYARRLWARQTACGVRDGIDQMWRRIRGLRDDFRSPMLASSNVLVSVSRKRA